MATRATKDRPNRPGRIGAWSYDHRRRVLAGWIVGMIAVIALSSAIGSRFENDFGGVGQSQQVETILQQRFPAQAGDAAQLVLRSSHSLGQKSVQAQINKVLAAIRPLPSVTSVSPLLQSPQGKIGFATIQFDAVSAKLHGEVQRVIDVAKSFAMPNLEIALGGPPISAVVSPSPGPSEGFGITAAIIIMLLVFGSVVAMGLPILTTLVGVGAGYGIVALVGHVLIDPSFSPSS